MSIVTLRSTEDFGGASATNDAAVNFQNHFKDPIKFRKDDTIEITSVTINQNITSFEITAANNEFQFRMGFASPSGDTPFFQLHRVRIPTGTYENGGELALAIAVGLNASLNFPGYTFTCQFDNTTNKFQIDMDQTTPANIPKAPGGAIVGNAGVNGQGVKLSAAPFLPAYPLGPPTPAPSLANIMTAGFGQTNQNPNLAPTSAEQLAILAVPKNLNRALLNTVESAVEGRGYVYNFPNGIEERAGDHQLKVSRSLACAGYNLIQNDPQAGGGLVQTSKHVKISNLFLNGAKQDRIYTASLSPVVGGGFGGNLPNYYYTLEDTTKYIGFPEAVALVAPNAITGINSSTNNLISGGSSYVVGDIVKSNVAVPDQPVAEILSVDGTGAVLTYRIIYPGSGVTAGQGVVFPNNRPGAPSLVVTMQTGGFRTSAAGINSASAVGANVVVGQTYQCSFPVGSAMNPATAGSILPISRTELDANDAAIDLKVKVTSIDATTRQVNGIEFVSCGLKAHDADFDRRLKIIQDGSSYVMLKDGNGNTHTPQSSWITISQLRSTGDDKPLFFGTNLEGLAFLNDTAAVHPLTPEDATIGGFSAVFTPVVKDATQTRAYIPNLVTLEQLNVDKTDENYGEIDRVGEEGPEVAGFPMKIERFVSSTQTATTIRSETKDTKANCSFNLGRASLLDTSVNDYRTNPQRDLVDECDFFCNIEQRPFRTATPGATRGDYSFINIPELLVGYQLTTNPGVEEIGATDGIATILTQRLSQNVITGYDMTKQDILTWTIDKLNNVTFTLTQEGGGIAPITRTFFDGGTGGPATDNPIRESMFPLMPIMAFSQGVPMIEQVDTAVPPTYTPQAILGATYQVVGTYHLVGTPIAQIKSARDSLIRPSGSAASQLEPPTTQPTILNQTGAGLTTLIQTPLVFKFGNVSGGQTTTADNPVPGASGATSDNIGAIDQEPNTANMSETLGMEEVVNKNNNADSDPITTISSVAADRGSSAPTVFLEFPDLNIQGYSGAAKDKFPIVATMPTEEWSTGLNNGTLHYKPLFPLPIDVNLPEDRDVYSMTARIRNLDGRLASNLRNPTTITFYKKEREGKALENALRRNDQRRSEAQDQMISTRTDNFPRV